MTAINTREDGFKTLEFQRDADFYKTRAGKAFEAKRYEEALELYRRALMADSNDADSAIELADAYFTIGWSERGALEASRAMAISGEDARGYAISGECLCDMGFLRAGRTALERACAMMPRGQAGLIRAIAIARELPYRADDFGRPQIRSCFCAMRAELFMRAGDARSARRILEKSALPEGALGRDAALRAFAWARLGDFERARALVRRALQWERRYFALHDMEGELNCDIRALCARALTRAGDIAGSAALLRPMVDGAEPMLLDGPWPYSWLNELVYASDGVPVVRDGAGFLRALFESGMYGEALALARSWLASGPKRRGVYIAAAACAARLGDLEEAAELLRRLLRIATDDAFALCALACPRAALADMGASSELDDEAAEAMLAASEFGGLKAARFALLCGGERCQRRALDALADMPSLEAEMTLREYLIAPRGERACRGRALALLKARGAGLPIMALNANSLALTGAQKPANLPVMRQFGVLNGAAGDGDDEELIEYMAAAWARLAPYAPNRGDRRTLKAALWSAYGAASGGDPDLLLAARKYGSDMRRLTRLFKRANNAALRGERNNDETD